LIKRKRTEKELQEERLKGGDRSHRKGASNDLLKPFTLGARGKKTKKNRVPLMLPGSSTIKPGTRNPPTEEPGAKYEKEGGQVPATNSTDQKGRGV